MDTILLVDAHAMMHRAYHALPPFQTKSGVPTNVVYGFFTMLQKAILLLKPTHVVACFDTPAKNFREELLPTYQAHRPKVDDSFIAQIPLIKDLLDTARVHRSEKDGLEADDIIGTIAREAHKHHMRTFILTGDKDIMQLVDKDTFIIAPQTGLSNVKVYDEKEVENKMGVPPSQIPDLKALMGDPSDNYKGAKGVGPKTAIKLLRKYGSIDGILQKSDEIDEESKKDVALSYKIATIVTDAPIEKSLKVMKFAGFDESFKKKLLDLEMYTLAKRIFNGKQADASKAPTTGKKLPHAKKNSEHKDQIGLF